MTTFFKGSISSIIAVGFISIFPLTATAYVGPGGVLSGIGSVIALIFAIIVAFIGFLWYPIKRFFFNRDRSSDTVSQKKSK